jgi:hypothetical protein
VLRSCSSLLSSLEAVAGQPLAGVVAGFAAAAIAIERGMVMNWGWVDDDDAKRIDPYL